MSRIMTAASDAELRRRGQQPPRRGRRPRNGGDILAARDQGMPQTPLLPPYVRGAVESVDEPESTVARPATQDNDPLVGSPQSRYQRGQGVTKRRRGTADAAIPSHSAAAAANGDDNDSTDELLAMDPDATSLLTTMDDFEKHRSNFAHSYESDNVFREAVDSFLHSRSANTDEAPQDNQEVANVRTARETNSSFAGVIQPATVVPTPGERGQRGCTA